MPKFDPAAVTVNAAGIADALSHLGTDDAANTTRFDELAERYEGRVGLMLQVTEAGEVMERYRSNRRGDATWGGELPYLYDVWGAIARALFDRLGEISLDTLVQNAIEQTVHTETV